MKLTDAFPSSYFKHEDLPKPATFIIADLEEVELQGTMKHALNFRGQTKKLILNKTNWETLAEEYGDESDNWTGKPIELFSTTTMFAGKKTPCVRLRKPDTRPAYESRREYVERDDRRSATKAAPFDDNMPF